MRRKLTTSAKSIGLLFLWLCFVNAQILMSLLCLIKWRLLHHHMALSQGRFWDSSVMLSPGGIVVMVAVGIGILLGALLPPLYYSIRRTRELEVAPFVMRYILLGVAALVAVIFGFTHGNPLLAFPMLGAAFVALCLGCPTMARIKRITSRF